MVGRKVRVTIRRIAPSSTKPVEDIPPEYEASDRVLAYWRELYSQVYSIQYEAEGPHTQVQLVDTLVANLGEAMVKKLMHALLRHPGADWVTSKTLSFLAKPTNRAFIVPLTLKKGLDFAKPRSTEMQITFRK